MKKRFLSLLLVFLLLISSVVSAVGCNTNIPNPGPDPEPGPGPVEPIDPPEDDDYSLAEGYSLDNVFRINSSEQIMYLNDKTEYVSRYANGREEKSKPVPVQLSWQAVEDAEEYTVIVSERPDLKDGLTFTSETNKLDVYNCKAKTAYWYQVTAVVGGVETKSEIMTFMTDAILPRMINCDGVTNMRDLGGYVVGDKVVKQGMLYRSGRLNKSNSDELVVEITEDGIKTMLDVLHVKTEIDLRRPVSVSNEAGSLNGMSVLGDTVEYYHCGMEWSDVVTAKDNYESIRDVFYLLSVKESYPLFFHCDIGTDRTGFIAYCVGAILGVDRESLQRDYLFSNFGNIGGSRSLGNKNFVAYADAIDNAKGETLAEKAEDYLVNTIGVRKSYIKKMREIMLEDRTFTEQEIVAPTASENGLSFYSCNERSSASYYKITDRVRPEKVCVSSADLEYLEYEEGYKVSAEKVISLDIQYDDTDTFYEYFDFNIKVPSTKAAGLLIKDDTGNYFSIAFRMVGEKYKLSASKSGIAADATYDTNGAKVEDKTTVDGDYDLRLSFRKDKAMFAYLDGQVVTGQFFVDKWGISDSATRLDIYLLWMEADTIFIY